MSTDHEQVKMITNPSGRRMRTFFIPSFIEDNQIGLQRDPEYLERLETNDPSRANALLRGDWESFGGQAFPQFDVNRHVIPQQALPDSWPVIMGIDGGTFDPFCALWAKVQPRTGRIFIYREIYQAGLTADVQAERIRMSEQPGENIMVRYADPSMWNKDSGRNNEFRSEFDDYLDKGIFLTKGDNNRVQGKKKLERYLADGPDGKPLLQIMENCYNLIEELPKLPSDPNNPEDVDPKAQADHAYAGTRYLLSNVDVYVNKEEQNVPGGVNRNVRQTTPPLARVKGL